MGVGEFFVDGARVPAAEALAQAGLDAAVARPEGRSCAAQRHAGLDGARACRPVRGRARASRRRSSPARSRPMPPRAPTGPSIRASRSCAVIAARSRWRPPLRALMAGQRHPRVASDERRPRAGSLLPALPAAGDGRRASTCCARRPRRLGTEANGVSDNPLVFAETGEVISGGNFHAEPVAFAADMIAMALCEIGSLAERRIAMLVDPSLSGLPAFLTPKPGLNSGFMIPQVTAAALVSENKQRAYPASVDSIPTSANQEDHVSMATHGARRLLAMAENTARRRRHRVARRRAGLRFPRAAAIERNVWNGRAHCCATRCRISTTIAISRRTSRPRRRRQSEPRHDRQGSAARAVATTYPACPACVTRPAGAGVSSRILP